MEDLIESLTQGLGTDAWEGVRDGRCHWRLNNDESAGPLDTQLRWLLDAINAERRPGWDREIF